jgi:hypothetical protein
MGYIFTSKIYMNWFVDDVKQDGEEGITRKSNVDVPKNV